MHSPDWGQLQAHLPELNDNAGLHEANTGTMGEDSSSERPDC